MSMNEKDISITGPQGTDVYPGVQNPAPFGNGNPYETNFVNDPTNPDFGAGAPSNFQGARQAKNAMNAEAGVVEARPGIIESTTIDPLDPNSNPDEDYANPAKTFKPKIGVTETPENMTGAKDTSSRAFTGMNTTSTGQNTQNVGSGTITDTVNTGTDMASKAFSAATGMATGAAKMAYGTAMGDQATLDSGKQDWGNAGTNK